LTPAVAVIRELRKRGYENFLWCGRRKTMKGDVCDSAEYRLVHEDMKIEFRDITMGKIVRFSDLKTFLEFFENIIKIPIGFIQAFVTLLKYKPSAIISFGGYLAIPFVIIGKFFGIPSVTHEQTVVLGLANKIVSKFVDKILISWEEGEKYFPAKKTIITGNPVRKEVLNVTTDLFNLNEKPRTIYITGGNQGAHIINKNVESIIENLLKKYNVIHQTGTNTLTGDFERLDKLSKSLTGKTKGNYIVKGTIYGPEIGEIFQKADLLVSRSGANICLDILATGNLAILIPIPWSINNEQFKNAKVLEKIGIGKILEEKNLKPEKLEEFIEEGMKSLKKGKDFNGKSLKNTIKAAKARVRLDAAERIVDEVVRVSKK
jgi:UDP-N-acetylglucosamine--N-acetylmuramyl-(pentapeptide) pyrophosphoryl-undecaprenol N-acetylglucosamine transferase